MGASLANGRASSALATLPPDLCAMLFIRAHNGRHPRAFGPLHIASSRKTSI
jgi:hypothetical protein